MVLNRYTTLLGIKLCSLIIGVILMIWNMPYTSGNPPFSRVLIAIDVSHSMNIQDTPEQKTRLALAQQHSIDSITTLPTDTLVGTIVFTDTTQRYIPPTLDHAYIQTHIAYLHTNHLSNSDINLQQFFSFLQENIHEKTYIIMYSDMGNTDTHLPTKLSLPHGSTLDIIGVGDTTHAPVITPSGTPTGEKDLRYDAHGRQLARQTNIMYHTQDNDTSTLQYTTYIPSQDFSFRFLLGLLFIALGI